MSLEQYIAAPNEFVMRDGRLERAPVDRVTKVVIFRPDEREPYDASYECDCGAHVPLRGLLRRHLPFRARCPECRRAVAVLPAVDAAAV